MASAAKRICLSPMAPTLQAEALVARLDLVSVEDKAGANGIKKIGTHNGTFQCDEALACAMLLTLPGFVSDVELVRTRDPEELAKCDIVVDVGGVYDHAKLRYDHHQREFAETMTELDRNVKLSAAGLVYRHYGMEVLKSICKAVEANPPPGFVPVPEALMPKLYEKMYLGFMEHVDGIDNGVNPFDGNQVYRVTTSLSARVGRLNPSWNEDYSKISGGENAFRNNRFREAMKLVLTEFIQHFEDMVTSWWPARAIVEGALTAEARKSVHPSGKVAVLPSFCPWQSHLFDLEKEGFGGLTQGEVLYMLFPDSSGSYRIQAVPVEDGGFANRKPLPEPWRGMRDEKCSEVSGVPDCIFVHTGGFIGGNKTLDGAKAMAAKAVDF